MLPINGVNATAFDISAEHYIYNQTPEEAAYSPMFKAPLARSI